MYKPNGNLYVGYFENGKAHGKGAFIFANGAYYEGDFKDNFAHSSNALFKSDEMTYMGGFNNNTFDGEGVEEGKHYRFAGTFKEGRRSRGILTWKEGKDQCKYEGTFNERNQFHGKGTFWLTQGLCKSRKVDMRVTLITD